MHLLVHTDKCIAKLFKATEQMLYRASVKLNFDAILGLQSVNISYLFGLQQLKLINSNTCQVLWKNVESVNHY